MILRQTASAHNTAKSIHNTYGGHNEPKAHTMITLDNHRSNTFGVARPEALSSPASKRVVTDKLPQRSPSSQSKWFATMIQNELMKSLNNLETDDDEVDEPVRDAPVPCHESSENCVHAPLNPELSSCCCCDLPESEMTIEQLQQFVIKQMPSRIQRKVPAEAWNQIFGSGSTKKNTLANKSTAIDLALRRSYSYKICNTLNEEEKIEEPQSPARKTSVSFGSVQVRYYERCIAVNPSVARGPAVGLGWEYNHEAEVPVDEWEANDSKTRGPRAFLLSRDARIELLLNLGYTREEITEVTRTILKARNERAITAQNLNVQEMEDAVETASRRVQQLLTFGKKRGLLK